MTTYIAFDNPDGSQTLVEIDAIEDPTGPGAPVRAGLTDRAGDVVRAACGSLRDALTASIRNNAAALYEGVQDLSPPPTEVEFTFALKATGELGNVAVGKVGAEANYTVKLVWKPMPSKAP